MDFVPVEELQKVLSYTDSIIQMHCIDFYKENGCSLSLLAGHLRAIEKLGNEALAIDDGDEVVEFWGGFEHRPLTKSDVHLRDILRNDHHAYSAWFTGSRSFGAKQFVHHCQRLQQKLSTVGAEILNPADEFRWVNENTTSEALLMVVERNLERRRKNTFDGVSFRHGLLLGLAFSKHCLSEEQSEQLLKLSSRAAEDNNHLGKTKASG